MTRLDDMERVLVIGLGVSGKPAAEKLLALGKRVTVNDISTSERVRRSAGELSERGAEVELGHHRSILLEGVDLVVVSPGVPSRLQLLREASEKRIPVWSEIELAWRFARGPVVAVTGTNGKTTTVSMIELIFHRAGRKACAAGNIGYPLIKAVDEAGEGEMLVVEVSSFQLVHIEGFHPRVAVLLNIAEDHFDWHEHLQEYLEAKSRIWKNQGEGDLAVCNLDDDLCVQASLRVPSKILYFSCRPEPLAATFLSEGRMVSRSGMRGETAAGPLEITRVDRLALPGEHNLQNAMAAATVGLAFGIEPGVIGRALQDFEGLPHRLQYVAESEGVCFYNDSKATNPHAAMRALSAFTRPLIVILGGRNKGLSFNELAAELEERRRGGGIRAIYLIGEAGEEIDAALHRASPRLRGSLLPGLEEVFDDLTGVAEAGDIVLFSPACASFDRYSDYRERGEHFLRLVEDYGRGQDGC